MNLKLLMMESIYNPIYAKTAKTHVQMHLSFCGFVLALADPVVAESLI